MTKQKKKTKTDKGKSRQHRNRSNFTVGQTSVLILLSIVMLALISGLGFAIAQSVLLEYEAPGGLSWIEPQTPTPKFTQSSPVWAATDSPMPTGTFPLPTLIPSQTQNPISTKVLLTINPPEMPTPVPSLTSYKADTHEIIGYSVEGRPIEMHRFGTGPQERLIVAGIHGGAEWNTIALAKELVAYLVSHMSTIPPDTSLFILPALNPDGEARSHYADGRANANNVDLNRNWDASWQANWPRHGCWNLRHTTAGPYPGSEPETRALMNFILSHNIDVMISYHSAALGILPSGEPYDPDSIRLAEEISFVSPYRYPPIDNGCQYSGTLVDWALKQGIVGVDLELRDHTNTEFDINLRVLSVLLNWQP